MDSKPTPSARVANLYYSLAVVGVFAAGVVWILGILGVKDNLGTLVYALLVVAGGVMCPSVALLAWWLRQAIRETDRAGEKLLELQRQRDLAEAKVVELREQLDDTVPAAFVDYEHLAIHFLEQCYQNFQLFATELKNEHGRNYVKAKDRHLEALRTLEKICRDRFEKDKRLLQRGLSEGSAVLQKYLSLKEELFDLCGQLRHSLSVRTNVQAEARTAIEMAASRMSDFVRVLDSKISFLTSNNHRSHA